MDYDEIGGNHVIQGKQCYSMFLVYQTPLVWTCLIKIYQESLIVGRPGSKNFMHSGLGAGHQKYFGR